MGSEGHYVEKLAAMTMDDKIRKFYIDMPSWSVHIKRDDFIVAIGARKSNSVYHVVEATAKPHRNKPRVYRHSVKAFKSDLITCLNREDNQKLFTVKWY